MICFENVCKTFENVEALKDVNLEIKEKDFFGIIGMSGAGKSTLVRLINGLILPESGKVYVNGQDLSALNPNELNRLRGNIGMIFQHFNLLNQRNVLDNVALPLKLKGIAKKEREIKARQILELVGLSDKINAYPAQLSGGQKQRVAIARALINENKLLLCDEVTSALDPISTQSVLSLLKELQKNLGLTIVLITHEMSVIEQVCNKVAILDEGQLVETGSVSEVFRHPKHPATKKLLGIKEVQEFRGHEHIRLTFDGSNAAQPIVSELVLLTGQKINILQADTRIIGDKLYGQMLISVNEITDQILDYLASRDVTISVERNVLSE